MAPLDGTIGWHPSASALPEVIWKQNQPGSDGQTQPARQRSTSWHFCQVWKDAVRQGMTLGTRDLYMKALNLIQSTIIGM